MATLTSERGPRSERGSQLIEFSLVLPLLLLVVLGIMDFGLLFQRYEAVTNAAREGARIAVLQGYGTADVQARVTQYLADAGLSVTGPQTPVIAVFGPQAANIGGSCNMAVMGTTVFYPNQYLFLGGIMGYFGGGSFGSKMISATARMRYEAQATGC
jgi:hypothetical protein